ncbi:MAG: septum formation inhibitor Maf [Thiotrichaceae bacterium]|nr:septum formation inhibitor Maf [Thiotrichaceae bacterium]
MQKKLVLGSTSPFRKELLEKLQIPFLTAAPDIDETREENEPPTLMVERLAILKAQKVAQEYDDALIIGSDQCAVLNDEVMGKPGHHEKATQQLKNSSGQRVSFYTGLCLLDSKTGEYQVTTVPFFVTFRDLTSTEINHYLLRDKPYHCAGSFKSEGLGISLFSKMEGDDPSALIGLPLIKLGEMLRNQDISLPLPLDG